MKKIDTILTSDRPQYQVDPYMKDDAKGDLKDTYTIYYPNGKTRTMRAETIDDIEHYVNAWYEAGKCKYSFEDVTFKMEG